MVQALRAAWEDGRLSRITDGATVKQMLDAMMAKSWVVFTKPHLQKPETIVQYLARYIQKIAICPSRIVEVTQTHVSFRWKDYADNDKQKIMPLEGLEFLRRYLLHVLPHGFMKIRHYGFFGQLREEEKLACIRECLSAPKKERIKNEPGENDGKYPCPKCRARALVNRMEIPSRAERNSAPPNTLM